MKFLAPRPPVGDRYDLVIVGAGPVGLAAAIAAKRAGFDAITLEKGCLVDSIFRFPVSMKFFTTPELMEIGQHPLIVGPHGKPTRTEALDYYRAVTRVEDLNVALDHEVHAIHGDEGRFGVETRTRDGARTIEAARVILATGYYDTPNLLGIPGEDLPHVAHYYTEAHSFAGRDVLVVGGKNSACEAALDLYRHDVRVTLVHRGETFGSGVKYWVEPDIRNRIDAGEMRALFSSHVREITRDLVEIETPSGVLREPFAHVFLLTGYHPDPAFLERCGLSPHSETLALSFDPGTLESTDRSGIYLAGSVGVGHATGTVFIENGRFDADRIVRHLAGQR